VVDGLKVLDPEPPIRKADKRGCGWIVRYVPLPEIASPFRDTAIGIALVSSGGHAMKLPRRRFLHLAAGVAALPVISRVARAQNYPTRPVRWIIGYPPGGSADITARLMGQWLSERLGQPFVIESRPGGGTNIATETVVRAPPDGYTLLLVAPANAINATLYGRLSYDFIRDIAPVAALIRFPNVIVVNPSVPAKTVPELIAYAKANPGKLNMASSGNGSTIHVSGELFKMMTGINMVHVPYRGGAPALIDMISGQVQVMFDNLPTSIAFIRAGKLRPLAVTTTTRSELLPDLPTVADFVPGYEASAWYGVGVPRGTPHEIIDKLNKEINAILADPKVKVRLAELGAWAILGSSADFGKLVADETEKWAKVVKFSGAKVD
jgi:tripartite-type tricarboxylate transporter receptor subunit TctC